MKKILFINQEITPYVPETVLANMGRNLTHAMQENGCEIRTFMPKWGNINERRGQLHEVIRLSGQSIVIDDIDHPTLIKVASIPQTKIQVYFIDNEDFFMKRKMGTDDNGVAYEDNGKRAIFFARAVIETLKKLRWTPDVIHCQGWMSAFVPFYLKKAYYDEPAVAGAKIVTSLFGKEDNAPLNDSQIKQHMEYRNITVDSLNDINEPFTGEDLAKLAVMYSDGIIDAVPSVDAELHKIAEEAGVKHLGYQGDDFTNAYSEFYDSLF